MPPIHVWSGLAAWMFPGSGTSGRYRERATSVAESHQPCSGRWYRGYRWYHEGVRPVRVVPVGGTRRYRDRSNGRAGPTRYPVRYHLESKFSLGVPPVPPVPLARNGSSLVTTENAFLSSRVGEFEPAR